MFIMTLRKLRYILKMKHFLSLCLVLLQVNLTFTFPQTQTTTMMIPTTTLISSDSQERPIHEHIKFEDQGPVGPYDNKYKPHMKKDKFRKMITSNESIYKHLQWPGMPTNNIQMRFRNRQYIGYGQCASRWPVFYKQHIMKATELQLIVQAYAEMFRVSCQPYAVKKLRELFEKGYARLEIDHSIAFSDHTIIFIKSLLSFQDMDDLESLLEFAAFTQTFVSWYKFPVNPRDPRGRVLSDSCFIEIVARLHVIDLTYDIAFRYTEHIAYLMAVKLKTVIKIMCDEYRSIKGHDKDIEQKRTIAKQCLVVTIGLMEFLYKYVILVYEHTCAHSAFEKFFLDKEKTFQQKAEKYGKSHKSPPIFN